jgi:16S rRNA (guanine527-N7)-methyltransferase
VEDHQIIFKYFPNLDDRQKGQIIKLAATYNDWNQKINLISRKDIDHLYERHVLHSLAIAKIIEFKPGASILDAGTGGGFPGIPLAILFPQAKFHLVDSIGKKIKAVKEVLETLGLNNVRADQERVENLKERYDFVISRAVTRMDVFLDWVKDKIKPNGNHFLKNGILYLKGGDLADEMKTLKRKHKIFPIAAYFEEEFFAEKKVIYLEGPWK